MKIYVYMYLWKNTITSVYICRSIHFLYTISGHAAISILCIEDVYNKTFWKILVITESRFQRFFYHLFIY